MRLAEHLQHAYPLAVHADRHDKRGHKPALSGRTGQRGVPILVISVISIGLPVRSSTLLAKRNARVLYAGASASLSVGRPPHTH